MTIQRPISLLLILAMASSAGTGSVAFASDRAAAVPQILPAGVTKGPSVEGISEYRLANGLRVLLYPDVSTPTTLVNVTYSVGAVRENYGETGMAHLLEHLLFKGTPTIKDIAGEFKRRGITFNGTTGREHTNYYGWFPANNTTLEWMLTAEADRMVNANVAKSELDSEMTVVRNEMEISENKPTSAVVNQLSAQAYLWHAYGRSVLGNRSDVENVPIDRLKAFYRTWYQPDNATLIVAGRFDPAHVLEVVQKVFGVIPRPMRVLPARYTVEPTQDGQREVTIRRTGDQPLLGIGYHIPATAHPDFAALEVMDSIMGTTPGGRLKKALMTTRLASSTESGIDGGLEPGMAAFYAAVAPNIDPARVENILIDQVEGLPKQPFTDQEVGDAKQRIANLYDRTRNGNVIGLANILSGAITAGDWRLYFLERDRIAAVTTADVNRVARTYLIPSNRTVARFVPTATPQRAQIPPAPDLAPVLAGYKGRPLVPTGEIFEPSVANIIARTETVTLGDGLKVALLPKRTRGDRVTADLTFYFGDDRNSGTYRTAGLFAGALLMRGSKTMTGEQIAKRFADLGARVSVIGSTQTATITINTSRASLLPALRLATDVLRNPVFPENELEELRMQAISSLERERSQPGNVADHAMNKFFDRWPKGDPRALPSVDERLAEAKRLTVEDVRAFHHDFYGTSLGWGAIVGNFEPAQLKRELSTLFTGWPSQHPYVRTKDPYYQPEKTVRQQFETPDKANAVIVSRHNLQLDANDPDHPALLVASLVFGGGAKASRLGNRIREHEGLSYYVGSGVIVNPLDSNGIFYMQATAAPENMGRVETAMREELARYVRDGITAEELADAKSNLLLNYEDARTSDAGIAAALRMDLFLDRPFQWDADFEKTIAGLTLDQVNGAIRRRIRPDEVSTFMAGDFAGAKARGAVPARTTAAAPPAPIE